MARETINEEGPGRVQGGCCNIFPFSHGQSGGSSLGEGRVTSRKEQTCRPEIDYAAVARERHCWFLVIRAHLTQLILKHLAELLHLVAQSRRRSITPPPDRGVAVRLGLTLSVRPAPPYFNALLARLT